MSKPFHVIATPDENGYIVTIPENPNVSARCADAADIIPTATAAKEQDEQNRHEKTAVCPKCGKTYTGYPATSRTDNKTEICPECGTSYVAGGQTKTSISYPNATNPYQQNKKALDALALRGSNVDYVA